MFFRLLKCPKCGAVGFSPDEELSLESYVEDYINTVTLVVPSAVPSFYPEYLIFSCSEDGCGYKEKVNSKVALEMLSKAWAELSWEIFHHREGSKQSFGNYFTSYLYEKGLSRFIEDRDYRKNPWLKEVIDSLQRANEKLTKNS